MRLAIVTAALVAAGCGASSTGAAPVAPAAPPRDLELESIERATVGAYVSPTCVFPDGKPHESAPTDQPVVVHGVAVRQPCGTIDAEIYSPEYLRTFAERVCGNASSITDAECGGRLTATAFARLRERFGMDVVESATQSCSAHPLECSGSRDLELLAIVVHNDSVTRWYQASVSALYKRRRDEATEAAYENSVARARFEQQEADRRRAIWRAVGQAAKSMTTPPTVNCISTAYGNTTTTNCR